MNHWAFRLRRVLQKEACVLVTVGPVRGSAPRSPGTRMLVTADKCRGSIGGGNLEFTAINRARKMLVTPTESRFELQLFGLGPELNQCCGGSVKILFEVFAPGVPAWLEQYITCLEHNIGAVLLTGLADGTPMKHVLDDQLEASPAVPPGVLATAAQLLNNQGSMVFVDDPQIYWLEPVQESRQSLYVFGAGHVGKALIRVLEHLPFDITWIDSRAGEFPRQVPASVTQLVSTDPLQEAGKAPEASAFLVMTHSHELDESLCFSILQRADFAWLGLIGSASKRRRFVSRLAKRGISEPQLERLTCPIGISGVKGKQPATIAVAVAAQLLTEFTEQTEKI